MGSKRYSITASPGSSGSARTRRTPSLPLDAPYARKTERTHEENQERAYIAASRRADRSIEARVQSARMASELHKKRTGKGFKITEEIVRKEEMYEEEDDLPRSYRELGSDLRTGSSYMNSRVEAHLAHKVAMANAAAGINPQVAAEHAQKIDRLFAESFPNVNPRPLPDMTHRLSQSTYAQPLFSVYGQPQQLAAQSHLQHVHHHPHVFTQSAFTEPNYQMSSVSDQPIASLVGESTRTPPLSPSSSVTPQSRQTPTTFQQQPIPGTVFPPASGLPFYDSNSASSSFTAELPQNLKEMANIDPNDTMTPAMLDRIEGMAPTADMFHDVLIHMSTYPPPWTSSAEASTGTSGPDEQVLDLDSYVNFDMAEADVTQPSSQS